MRDLKRKLYRRGSSFETTVPMPLLFGLDANKRYHVVFNFDSKNKRWYVEFEEIKNKKERIKSK